MNRQHQPALITFAVGLIGLGVLTLIYDDFALVWQPVPPSLPGRSVFAYASGIWMLLGGIGLLFRVSAAWSARIPLPYFFAWLLLKVPAIVVIPRLEAVWLGFGEIAVLFAAGCMLLAIIGEVRSGSILFFSLLVTQPYGSLQLFSVFRSFRLASHTSSIQGKQSV